MQEVQRQTGPLSRAPVSGVCKCFISLAEVQQEVMVMIYIAVAPRDSHWDHDSMVLAAAHTYSERQLLPERAGSL